MNIRNIFLYWIGKEYTLIKILRKLIYLHSTNGTGYKVILITDKNINEYIKFIPEYFNKLCPAHQADFVRVNVICDYGGIWLDSDTLVLDTLDSLFNFIELKNGFFIKENNSYICNGIFGSKPNTEVMIQWKKELIDILNNKKGDIHWSEIGSHILQKLYIENPNIYENYHIFDGLHNLYPINFNMCLTEFINKPYDNYKTIIREYQPLIILVHSVYKTLENKTEQDILDGNMPLNYFINKSLTKQNITKNYLIFENIYEKQLWNNGNPNIPLSGPGSSIENTRTMSAILNTFIYNNNCKSVLDLGCGDLNWISKTPFFNDNDIKYTGVDVVENVINTHLKMYNTKTFLCKDIITFNNFNNIDIIIIRDVIFHLKNEEILSIFNNIQHKFKFLLITSCLNNENNDTFDRWHFSKKNINIEPFNKKHNFKIVINEEKFNKKVYIYEHDNFYL
jgi:hypothetical protein